MDEHSPLEELGTNATDEIYYKIDDGVLHLSAEPREGYEHNDEPLASAAARQVWGWCRGWSNPDITKVVIENEITLPPNSSGLFAGLESLTEVEGLDNLDTSNVTDMSCMFNGCHLLESLDLSSFDTSNVTDMSGVFYGCPSLKSLDLSSFDTSNVTDTWSMFADCSSLVALDLSGWDTGNFTDMDHMFAYCRSLKDVDFSGWEVDHHIVDSDLWEDNGIFQGCDSLSTRTVEQISTEPPIFYTYKGDELHIRHEVEGGDDGWVYTKNHEWVSDADDLDAPEYTKVVIEDRVTLPEDASGFFCNMGGVTSIEGLENLDTSHVTDMFGMFNNCQSLRSLDLSTFDTSKVWDMSEMFADCQNLTTANLVGWDTSKVRDTRYMFSGCESLVSLTLKDDEKALLPAVPKHTNITTIKAQAPEYDIKTMLDGMREASPDAYRDMMISEIEKVTATDPSLADEIQRAVSHGPSDR